MSYARIQVTIEINGIGSYGPDWTIGSATKQCASEAKQALENRLQDIGLHIIGEPVVKFVTIIGEPVVKFVTVTSEEKS